MRHHGPVGCQGSRAYLSGRESMSHADSLTRLRYETWCRLFNILFSKQSLHDAVGREAVKRRHVSALAPHPSMAVATSPRPHVSRALLARRGLCHVARITPRATLIGQPGVVLSGAFLT